MSESRQGSGFDVSENINKWVGHDEKNSAISGMTPPFQNKGHRALQKEKGARERLSPQVVADLCSVFDFLIIFISALAAKYFYIDTYLGGEQPLLSYAYAAIIGSSVGIFILRRQGAYSIEALGNMHGHFRRIVIAVSLCALILFGLGYFLKIAQSYSRGWIVLWFATSSFLLITSRFVSALILKRWISKGFFAKRVAIFGNGMIGKKLLTHLRQLPESVSVIGVFDDDYASKDVALKVSGGLSELIRLAQRTRIDEVMIALPFSESRRIERLFLELSILPSAISLCPDLATLRLRPKRLVDHNGAMLLELASHPLDDWSPIIKAVEDKILATLLLIFATPIMILIALMIKLDSKGPFFFRQRRHGFNHEIISVLKFRTMTVSEDGPTVIQAQKEDARVTRVGRFLRRSSLDELPQLINVLMGTMSLVGPRPHALAHNEYYSSTLESYAARHKVKPGITGWAQINGFRGETDTPEKMRKRVECDLYYIENWSIWFDLKIILLTPFYGLIGKNVF